MPAVTLVADDLRKAICQDFNNGQKPKGVTGWTLHERPGHLIMQTVDGDFVVKLTDDGEYIYFATLGGSTSGRMNKQVFLQKINRKDKGTA